MTASIMEVQSRSDESHEAHPVVMLLGGQAANRRMLIQHLNSLNLELRLLELEVATSSCQPDEDGDGGRVIDFLEDFSLRMRSITHKDRELLRFVLAGTTNKSIALQLDVSQRAVELRKASIMKKLNARSHTDLVRRITRFFTLQRYIAEQAQDALDQQRDKRSFTIPQ